VLSLHYKGDEVREMNFIRLPQITQAIYGRVMKQAPIFIDDEEILAELFAFSATLTPLV